MHPAGAGECHSLICSAILAGRGPQRSNSSRREVWVNGWAGGGGGARRSDVCSPRETPDHPSRQLMALPVAELQGRLQPKVVLTWGCAPVADLVIRRHAIVCVWARNSFKFGPNGIWPASGVVEIAIRLHISMQ